MRKTLTVFIFVLVLVVLSACSENNKDPNNGDDELKALEVEFNVPKTAELGETIELKAIVTYGDEKVEDADEVKFEYWEKGNEDDSITIESNNNKDGTYTAEVAFEQDGVYEMYAHTTARALHTMPKKAITVGDGIIDGE